MTHRIAVIVDDPAVPTPGDQLWLDVIAAAGHTAKLVPAAATDLLALLTGCDGGVATGSVDAGDLGAKLRGWAKPLCVCAGATGNPWQPMGLTEAVSASSGATTIWTMATPANALQAGRVGNVTPWSAGVTRHVPAGVPGSIPLAYLNGSTSRWCYWLVPAGTELAGEGTAPALRIALAADDAGVAASTAAYRAWMAAVVVALTPAAPPPADTVPSVVVSADPLTALVGQVVTLTAVETLQPGASAVTARAWTPAAGAPALTGGATTQATFTPAAAGEFAYTYVATNAAGSSEPRTVTVRVLEVASRLQWVDEAGTRRPARLGVYLGDGTYRDLHDGQVKPYPPTFTTPPPGVVADAGPDQARTGAGTVTLAGSASGGDGGPYTYAWTQLQDPEGPTVPTVELSDPSDPGASFPVADVDATYVLQLEASDGTTSGTDTVAVAVTASTTPPPPDRWAVVVADDTAATGTANPNNGDAWIAARVDAVLTAVYGSDFEVEFVSCAAAVPAGRYVGAFISPSANSATLGTKWRAEAIPLVVSLGSNWDEQELAQSGGSGVASQTSVDVLAAAHPIAAGRTGTVTIFSGTGTTIRQTTNFEPGADLVASITGQPTQVVIAALDTGDVLNDGQPAPARRVALGFDAAVYNTSGSPKFNADGLAIFDAALLWAAGGA